jgi:hypothetical protein
MKRSTVLSRCSAVALVAVASRSSPRSRRPRRKPSPAACSSPERRPVDLDQALEAIEKSNKAFEEFKKINDQRLKLIEEGKGGDGDLEGQDGEGLQGHGRAEGLIETSKPS